MAFDFAQRLNFSYSPEGVFVDVYVNGKYMGLYLLCEAVNEGKSRVNIDMLPLNLSFFFFSVFGKIHLDKLGKLFFGSFYALFIA